MFQKILRNLSLLCLAQDKPDMGAKYIMEAIETTKPSGDHLLSCLVVLGYAHERNENYDSAIDVYEQILASVKSRDMRVSVSEHLARVCLYSDRFDRAESLFRYVSEERKSSLGESHPKSKLAARNLAIAIGSRASGMKSEIVDDNTI